MSDFFLDTSALVKRYVQEPGTSWGAVLTHTAAANTIVIAEVTEVEAADYEGLHTENPNLHV